MNKRLFALTCLATLIMAVVVLLKVAPVPVAGQGATAKADAVEKAGPAGKTSWGEPDLQGIWTNQYDVPLQRPPQYANKEFFTEEERAEIDRKRAGIIGSDQRSERKSEQDVGGAYNAAIFLTHKHAGRRTSLIVDPPDGRIPPLTPEAKKMNDAIRDYQLALLQPTDTCKNKLPACAGGKYGPPSPRRAEPPPFYPATGAAGGGSFNRSDGPEDRGLSERCMGARLPDFGGATGFFLQIVQSPGTVSIFYDTGQGQGWQRIVPLTNRPHLPSQVRQWWGDSRGRWEGDTLVVDVTNFTAKTDFQSSRENLHLVERWRRVDAQTIDYTVTVEDPTTWTRPWTVKQELSQQSKEANRVYKEPRCHEGNYGMPALLAGARAEEKAFAQGRGPNPATLCTAGCGGFDIIGVGDVQLNESDAGR
jgi:hypothetical protein